MCDYNFAYLAMKWFEKVRGGSLRLNHKVNVQCRRLVMKVSQTVVFGMQDSAL